MNPAPSAYDQIHKARLPLKTAMARRLYPHPRLVLTWCHRGSRLAVIGFLCAAADLNAQGGNLALTATTGVASRYVYRGVERSTTAWQAGVDGSVDGWRGQFWSNRPFDGAKTGELQSSLGYVWTPSGAITLEASGTHFWYVDPTIKGAAAHSFEGAAFMGWNRSDGWRPGVSLAYDIRYRSLAVETSLAYVVALKSWGTFWNRGHMSASWRETMFSRIRPAQRFAIGIRISDWMSACPTESRPPRSWPLRLVSPARLVKAACGRH